MRLLLVFIAIIAAAISTPVLEEQKWPWQVGKLFHYDVYSHTFTKFEESFSQGTAFKAQFIISVKTPGYLVAKLQNSSYAPFKALIPDKINISDLKYQSFKDIMDQTFEIFVDGGRVVSINMPYTLSVTYTNFLKGLISALQVDLSPFNLVSDYPNSFDKNTFQGFYKKQETDVTGQCETLYSVLPIASEWRRELPHFTSEEDLVEITKSRNYGKCQQSIIYYEGVPQSKVLHGRYEIDGKQLIQHNFHSRILAGKQGPIYKVEAFSSAISNHIVHGKQEAEVFSYVKFYLNSVEQDTSDSYQKPDKYQSINTLLYVYNKTSLYSNTLSDPQAISKAQVLLQELAPMLQNPNNMTNGKFLLNFQLLVDILSRLNSEQVTYLSNSIEVARTSKNIAKNSMWAIYRDAVVSSGTTEAYEQIKRWIINKKIEDKEAAEVIAALGVSFSNPSIDLLKDFFKFSTSLPVTELKVVNNSALLTSSISWARYLKDDKFIDETMVPYFAKQLKQAIENVDTNNAQVYIKALGNLAHPSIIKVFAPYLEGHIKVSKYIRTQMIINLKDLAYLRNEYVRAVLYNIVRNSAEVYEVRVAAVMNLFLAFPTAEMMQVLALMTQYDPSTQVRAILTKSITIAAGLKDPCFAELAKNAQSVMYMVTNEKFDSTYSTVEIQDIPNTSEGDADNHYFALSSIGSKNSFLPKYIRSALRYERDDYTEITLSISDVQDFINSFMKAFYEPIEVDHKFKFSAKQVIEMLKIKSMPRQPLESALFINDVNQQELITFSEKDLYKFMSEAANSIENLLKGTDTRYSKISYIKNILVSFPLASGLPFVLTYTEPYISTAQTFAEVAVDKKTLLSGSLKTRFDFTYAYEAQIDVSFINIFGDMKYAAGISRSLQFQIPLKMNIEFSLGQGKVQFEPLYTDRDINLFQFSIVPYTGVFNSKTLTYETEPIKRSEKTIDTDLKFGQPKGMVYQVQGYSYSADYKDWEKMLIDDDFNPAAGDILYQKDNALTDFTLKYLAKESTMKSTTFILYFDTLYNLKNSGQMGPATTTKHVEANSEARRKEMIKKVSSGIDSATVQLLDFSVKFEGQRIEEFVFTGAMAYSVVDPKFQAAFFAHSSDQINAVFKLDTKQSKLNLLNLEEVLKNDLTLSYEGNMKYQNNTININGYGTRSKEYTELLKKDPVAKHCVQDIGKQNLYQKDCYNMIIKAYAPDYFKTTVTYSEIDPIIIDIGGYAYNQYIKHKYSMDDIINTVKKTNNNKIELEAQWFYYDNYFASKFITNYGSINLDRVKITSDYHYAMSMYAPVNYVELNSFYWTSEYEMMTYCAIDDNKVWTFSGRSYDYALTGSWHVVMVDANDIGNDLTILARRPSANQEQIYISYKTQFGQYFELDIKPDNIEVKSNANKTSDGALTMYWDSDEEIPLLEYYTVDDGVYIFDIHSTRLHLVYDKHRLIIFTVDFYGSTWGVCGQSSTEIRDDYMSPWGLVDLPEHYGASFSLESEFSDPKTVELKTEARLKSYQPKYKFTNVVGFDSEWSKTPNVSQKAIVRLG